MLYIKDLSADEKAMFMAYLRSLAAEKTETVEPAPVSPEEENHIDSEFQSR